MDDLDRPNAERIESEADDIAQEALIPMDRWDSAKVRKTLLSDDAIAFADAIGVHPAIVAGRLRHETKNFRLMSHLIGKAGQVSKHLVK
jgi:HTH-type transcriptional regulator/antitoxin HigA